MISTIFRTINDDAKRLTDRMGLLNKSFRDIKKDFSTGQGWSNSLFKTSITQNDFQNLQKFNSAIKIANDEFKITNDRFVKSQQVTKAWNENMTGCSIAAKRLGNDLVTGKKTIKDISAAMNSASTSTKALGVAMNVLANVGLMLAISAVMKVISELSQAQEKAVQMAKEATESYKDEISSISDYKTRLSELHKELNSGNLSYEETKTKRSELMSIQDELIKKFGTEKTAIEAVTKAIDGQVNSLDTLNEKSYREWVAKADEQSFWNKLLPWGKSGLDQAVDYMESDQTISFFDMSNANSRVTGQYADLNAVISDEVRAIQEEIDKTIQSKYNLEKEFATFKLTGTPDEIKSQLEAIRQDYIDLSKDAFLDNGISSEYWEAYRSEVIDSINEVINKLDDGLTKHQDTYKTYIEGMIKYDSEYSDEYATILQKRAELESAQNSGNKEEIQKARQSFMGAISQGIEASGTNENIKKYFETLYPELQAEFASWNFEFSLNANTDGIKDIATQIGEKYTATNLLDMVNTEGVQEGEDSFNKLIDKAIEYGICTDNSAEEVQKLIDLLVELGIVQGEVSSENADKMTVSLSEMKKASDKISKLGSVFKELSDDGYITTKTLGELQTATGLSGDEWAEYEDKLLNAKKGSSEFNQVMSDLTYKMLDNSFASEDLTNITEDQIAAILRENGVINASTVAHEWLTKAKFANKVKTQELISAKGGLINISDKEIAKLKEEAMQCGYTESAFWSLIAQEQIFNNTSLDVTQQISALKSLEIQAGITKGALSGLSGGSGIGDKLNDAMALGVDTNKDGDITFNGKVYGKGSDAYNQAISDASAYAFQKDLETKYKNTKVNYTVPNYSGVSSDSGSSSSKNEALDNYLKDAENRYKIHQDETKYINDLNYALSNLVKTEDERLDVTGKINEAYRDLADNRIKDLEHQIDLTKELKGENADVTAQYDEIQRVANEEANRLRAMDYDDNSNEIQALQKTWWDAENSKLDFYSKQHENLIRDIEHARDMALEANPFTDTTSYYKQMQEEYHKEAERLRALDPEKYAEDIQELQLAWHDAQNAIADWSYTNSENWIALRNTYNDWEKFGDSEAKAWKRVLDRFRAEFPAELDKIRTIEENYYNAIKADITEILNLNQSRIESQKTLLQSYYDVRNAVSDAQHEINKELAASLTMSEYLDERTKDLLFNQKDYNTLADKLVDIQGEAEKLQRKYNQDILSATADNLDEITSKYQMQYETLMKTYEIAKAELEVAKKRQQLDNVLNERNVRMFVNGQWQWVANTQDVINAQNELADAKYEAQQAQLQKEQTDSMNELTAASDKLTTTINKIDSGAIDLSNGVGNITSSLNRVATRSVPALEDILNNTSNALRRFANNLQSNVSSSSDGENYIIASGIPGIEDGSAIAYRDSNSRSAISANRNGVNISTIYTKNAYANGTRKTTPGLTLFGEGNDSFEAFINSNGHLIPINQPVLGNVDAGGIVFNHAQMENLRSLWDLSNINRIGNIIPSTAKGGQTIEKSIDNRIIINGMTVDSGSSDGQALINALRRYVGNH